jgi:3-(3-hydroxy-phenyl)propionate hydroxylase
VTAPAGGPASPLPVVIVGAGPTGATTAALLARYGVRSVVLERRHAVHAGPRAVHVDDEVCRILHRVGVAAAFATVSRPARGLRLVDQDLRLLAEFRRDARAGRHGYPQANMFDQPDLERLLRGALAGRTEVELRSGADVTGVCQHPDHVLVTYVDAHTGEVRHLRAAFVLGCDGAGSLVRRQIGARMRDLRFEQRWLVVDVETAQELGHWDGVHQVCDPGRPATFMRVGAHRYRWEFRLLDGENAADFTDLIGLMPLLRPWLKGVDPAALTLQRSAEYTFRAQVADVWRDRRIMLLGDAAHLTPPFIGQGLCAGLRDADNLAWKLAGVLSGALPVSVLDSYERERKPHATAMIRLAILVGLAMSGGGRTTDAVRRTISPYLHLVPGLRARVLDSATPRLRRSRPTGTAHRRTRLSGRLCPNVLLRDGTRLDDAGAFLLVTRVPLPPRLGDEVVRRGAAVVSAPKRSELARWLRRGGATLAVVRPDGTVLAAGRRPATICAALPAVPIAVDSSTRPGARIAPTR